MLLWNDFVLWRSVKYDEVELPTKRYQEVFIRRNLHHNRYFFSNIIMHFWCTFKSTSKLFFRMRISEWIQKYVKTSTTNTFQTSLRRCNSKVPTSMTTSMGCLKGLKGSFWRCWSNLERENLSCYPLYEESAFFPQVSLFESDQLSKILFVLYIVIKTSVICNFLRGNPFV